MKLFKTINALTTVLAVYEVGKLAYKHRDKIELAAIKVKDQLEPIIDDIQVKVSDLKAKFSNKEAKADVTDHVFDESEPIDNQI